MKKLFLLFALIGISFHGYGQDVKVNINNQDGTAKDDCPYRINGICATEDIGGVDVQFMDHTMVLTNYNNFPVNVLWKIKYYDNYYDSANGTEKTGSVVLGVEGSKVIGGLQGADRGWSVTGLIVRRLAQ